MHVLLVPGVVALEWVSVRAIFFAAGDDGSGPPGIGLFLILPSAISSVTIIIYSLAVVTTLVRHLRNPQVQSNVIGSHGQIGHAFDVPPRASRQSGKRSRQVAEAEYAAKAIRAFLSGSGGKWDWDTFTSCSLTDAAVDVLRRQAAQIELPPGSEEQEALLALARDADRLAAHSMLEPLGTV